MSQLKISRYLFYFCALLMIFVIFPLPVTAQTGAGKAWIIPIRGDIEPSLTAFVRREARKAINQGAEYLIFEIDTFGGRVDSALQITSFIMSVKKCQNYCLDK